MTLPSWVHGVAAIVSQVGLLVAQFLAAWKDLPAWAVVAIAALQALVGIVLALGAKAAVQILDEAEDLVAVLREGRHAVPTKQYPVPPSMPKGAE